MKLNAGKFAIAGGITAGVPLDRMVIRLRVHSSYYNGIAVDGHLEPLFNHIKAHALPRSFILDL